MNNGQTGCAGIAPGFDSLAPGGKAILDKRKYRAHLLHRPSNSGQP